MQMHEIAARLAALEYVVTEVGCLVCAALGSDVESMRQVARAKLGQWSFPGLKEEYSDDLSAETREAVDALLHNIQTTLRHHNPSRR